MAFQKDAEQYESKALRRLVDFNGQRALEVGRGEGHLTWRFARLAKQLVGIDPDQDTVRVAYCDIPRKLQERTAFACTSSLNLPFPPETFDIALLSWSL